ncbi:MAG: RdgB/HAM1 family non-canonical purine NTP pyrophosphatase [Christensenellaceae bacterium]|nr:RdgB/HAM1 family non-canonical purine NTP pyrophosphatase [Christensenellaceae bacterium]
MGQQRGSSYDFRAGRAQLVPTALKRGYGAAFARRERGELAFFQGHGILEREKTQEKEGIHTRLIIASGNAHKVREIKQIAAPFFNEILSLKEAGLSLDVKEDGQSFYENAKKKAAAVAALSGCAALADDSGLCVDALGGAPGIFSARFAGEGASDGDNNALLLKRLQNSPAPRAARYACAIVLLLPDGGESSAYGECAGHILEAPQGSGGFGYDPLFVPEGFSLSFGQIPAEEKNQISHRAKALRALAAQLGAQKGEKA